MTDHVQPEAGDRSGELAARRQNLAAIRGWLLLFAIGLVPHIVFSAVNLAQSWQLGSAPSTDPMLLDLERARTLMALWSLAGNSVGLALILLRSRYAPGYFTLYFSLSILLILAARGTVAAQVVEAERLGVIDAAGRGPFAMGAMARILFSLALSFIWTVYWLRSRRVQAVFGRTGFEALRRTAH